MTADESISPEKAIEYADAELTNALRDIRGAANFAEHRRQRVVSRSLNLARESMARLGQRLRIVPEVNTALTLTRFEIDDTISDLNRLVKDIAAARAHLDQGAGPAFRETVRRITSYADAIRVRSIIEEARREERNRAARED